MFRKTVIFGNFCHIWHHLATLTKSARYLRSGQTMHEK